MGAEVQQSNKKQGKQLESDCLDQLLGFVKHDGDEGSVAAQEVRLYLHEQPVSPRTDPLDWWKLNSARFPRVAQVARTILSIPATSTPAERVFSGSGNIVDKKRNRLKPSMVDALVFLNKNEHLLAGQTVVRQPAGEDGVDEDQPVNEDERVVLVQ